MTAFVAVRTAFGLACGFGVLQGCYSGDAVAPELRDNAKPPQRAPVVALVPRITAIGPDTLQAGGALVVEGEHLLAAAQVKIEVAGVELSVRARSDNRIEAVLPPGAFPCAAPEPQSVRVSLGSTSSDVIRVLRPALRVSLSAGQGVSLMDTGESRCVELVPDARASAARYVLAVVNTSINTNERSSFTLSRVSAGGAVLAAPSAPLPAGVASQSAIASLAPRLLAARRELDNLAVSETAHGASLTLQTARARRGGSAVAAWQRSAGSAPSMARQLQGMTVGDTVAVTVSHTSCSSGRVVRARIVYKGTRALVLEDVSAPKAGRMDAEYRQIGGEFDAVVYPLLRGSVGDPLAMNARLGGDGRVTMLFTPYVNDSLPGTAAFVNACDFYPRSTFAASNQDELFYGRVASQWETPQEWRRAMRATVVHESKHLASFAERLSRGVEFEEPWLEEATARIAEELYARTFPGGGAWKGNVGFATSVGCELLQCDDRPLIMWKHFSVLHHYLRGADTLSPLGPARAGDNTYYASGWALVRWMLDRYAPSENTWLQALVRGETGALGMSALSALSGQSTAQLAVQWATHNLRSSAYGSRMAEESDSWNFTDQWAGVAQLFPGLFTARPVRLTTQAELGGRGIAGVQSALGASYFVVDGSDAAGSQAIILQLNGAGARGPALAISRLE